jgi:hypothetical protein
MVRVAKPVNSVFPSAMATSAQVLLKCIISSRSVHSRRLWPWLTILRLILPCYVPTATA